MPTAHVNFEDRPDGTINVQVVFSPDGFDQTSHAHQHAQIVLKFLDGVLTRIGEPTTEFLQDVATAPTLHLV